MAHLLDMTKGEAAFARVEGSRDAWHGLGRTFAVDASIEQIAEAAGLDYHVARVPSFFKKGEGFEEVSNAFHLIRDDSMSPIGVPVSASYHPVQPIEALEFMRDFFTVDDRFTMETAGALKGGAVIWALARFNDSQGLTTIGGAKHELYAMLATSFDKSRATMLRGTSTCVVCDNTLRMSDRDAATTLKITHRTKFAGRVRDDAARDFATLVQGFEKFKAMGDAFAQVTMSKEDVSAFFKTLLDIPLTDKSSDISGRKQGQFMELCRALQTANRAEAASAPMSKFAALQAVTRYVDHERSTRDNGDGVSLSRLYSAQFGSGADMKTRAVDLLLAA